MKGIRLRVLAAAAVGAFGAGLSPGAFAAGTPAGTNVTNDVTVGYSVGAIVQADETAATTFTVDRKLDVLVTANATDVVFVVSGGSGGQNDADLTFTVTNLSNDTTTNDVGLRLAVIDQDNTLPDGTTQGTAFNANNIEILIDFNNDTTIDQTVSGTVADLSAANVPTDTPFTVIVRGDIPASLNNNDTAGYTLVAAVANSAGTAVIGNDDSGNSQPGFTGTANDEAQDDNVASATPQDVFTDAATAVTVDVAADFTAAPTAAGQDTAFNGQHSDTMAYVVRGANLEVTKTSEVVWDPVSGAKYNADRTTVDANPKAIPGAVVMYVIAVANNGQFNAAQSISVGDDLPAEISGGTAETFPVPASITVNFPVAGATAYSIPASADLTAINVKECTTAAFGGATAFSGSDPEVSVTLANACGDGNATANEDADYALVVYFVEIQ